MEKQKKPVGSKFFDEMEEKMQIEGSKRRKLSKKTGYSQPELLFLQFNPNTQELETQNNSFNSQPSSINTCKKTWKPPVKCSKVLNSFEFYKNKTLGTLSMDRLNDNVINKNSTTKADITLESADDLNNEPIEINSSPSVNTPISKTAIKHDPIKQDPIKHTEQNTRVTQNISTMPLHTNFETKNNDEDTINYKTGSSNTILNFIENSPSATAEQTTIDNIIKLNKWKEEFATKIQLDRRSSNDNVCFKNRNDISSENYNKNWNDNLDKTPKSNITPVEIAEVDNSLKTKNVFLTQQHEINKTHDAIEIPPIDISHNSGECLPEHDDIIHSIDLILSEGENSFKNGNTDSNISKTVGVFDEAVRGVNDDEDLVDSYFKDSQADSESNDDTHNGKSNSTEKKEQSQSDNMNTKDSKEVKKCLSNNTVPYIERKWADEGCKNIPTTKLSLEEEDFDHIVNKHMKNDSVKSTEDCENINKINKEFTNAVDEEYSCLMISNSQLLEIENTYCNNPNNPVVSNKPMYSVPNNNICPKTESKTIGTQTYFVQEKLKMADQCKLLAHVAPIQWPKNMQNAQKRLRDVIQEIDRLNATLLKARQQIWPLRHGKAT